MELDGYFYIHFSGQPQTSLERRKKQFHEPWKCGARDARAVRVFVVFENFESIIFIGQHTSACPRHFH